MKQLELWRWRVRGVGGKVHTTRYVMTEEEALQRHPGAQRAPGTLELRDVPQTPAEMARQLTGAGIRSGLVPPRGWWRQPAGAAPAAVTPPEDPSAAPTPAARRPAT
jgi:hypothetical protein